jgi:regulator of protease activity HflC (stomatin/prohibitin superfamily)
MTDDDKNTENQIPVSQIQEPQDQLDSAARSLTDALKISFGILKIIMLVLVVLFFTSGIFRVQENEKAMVLNFGKIRGDSAEQRILKPGLRWAWPEPIDEIVVVPVSEVLELPMNEAFWYFLTDREKATGRISAGGATLNPTRDGYLLTRNDAIGGYQGNDYNIVHSRWKLTYRISDPEKFFKNIYYREPRPGETFLEVVQESLDPLLEAIASDVVVTTMVNYSIDEAIVSDERIQKDVRKRMQAKLDMIDSGIEVDAMRLNGKISWPRQVNNAFEASNKAQQNSDQEIINARDYYTTTLTETGGRDAGDILKALKAPDITEKEKQRQLARLIGSCREKLDAARQYRTEVVKEAQANAEYLKQLLPEYRKRPQLILQRLYQDAMEQIMENVEEKIFVQPSVTEAGKELRILINRDPNIKKQMQEDSKTK